jgi:predicted MFS family arabinose efflux permease
VPAAPGSPWSDPPYVAFLVLVAVQAMIFFQLFSTYPLHLREHYATPESVIGLLLAGNAITIVFVEMVLVRAVEHRHPLRVAAWGALLIGLGLGLLPLGPPAWVAVASVAVWTAGEMLALPMTNVAAASRAPEGASGRYMGAYTVAFSSAFVIGPLAGTALYEAAGPRILWGAVAATGGLLWAGFMALAPVFRHDRHGGGLAPAAPAPAPPGGSDVA